ncbi:hypothetical protein J4409_02850 [Candidatus Woesearchaeota archaeon]|nr:hypothetical protein [Candidatus Woesearchaeota archaeon]
MKKMVKILTLRVWILIFFIVISILAIKPVPFASGVEIKSVSANSLASDNGLSQGMKILKVNDMEIKTMSDYNDAISKFNKPPIELKITTDKKEIKINVTNKLKFAFDENLTVLRSETPGIAQGDRILKINNYILNNLTDYLNVSEDIIPKKKISIATNKGEVVYLTYSHPEITIGDVKKTNIVKGLDLEGGTRVLLAPKDKDISDSTINDIISVLRNRLNVYGLTDLSIKPANDLAGNSYILIEIAGISSDEVEGLISAQGKFEAKIENETVFVGSKKDIPFVCRGDGSCSGIRSCGQVEKGYQCQFEFAIKLSQDAAKKHAMVTDKLEVVLNPEGGQRLSKNIDFYLDGQLVDSLQIGADLKGKEATDIAISGPGFGADSKSAQDNTIKNMDRLQTILITGSLPADIEIAKLDNISPTLGEDFIKNTFLVMLFAIIATTIVVYIRYRKTVIIIPIILTMLSEILIIFGIAALIKWNIDIAAIVGIIAAVGTGVDDQIVITDEALYSKKEISLNWKQRIKRAFSIIFTAFATSFVSMLPLFWAAAGLIRGFALTTIIGISVGVFITRPAFASIIEYLLNK